VASEASQPRSRIDELRILVPVFALAVAVVAAVTDPTSAGDLVLMAIPVGAFAIWAFVPRTPLVLVTVAVVVPVVAAQRAGAHQALMFEVSVLAFVIAFWERSLVSAVPLGLVALASPPVVAALETQGNIAVGIWILGIAFPWAIGRAILRQVKLAAQLEATRRELARQAMLEERRRIARDVLDFVGHGLAAVMLQVTSARHVLRRDPAAAEDALRSAEDVGRRSMQELRRNVALLRSDEQPEVLPPVPSAIEIPALVDHARAGGLPVELQMRGDLATISPTVGLALYRITQEALANAARHAPEARTALILELLDGEVSLVAETTGPLRAPVDEVQPRRRYGLIGMRERATALGGDLTVGPKSGGWRLSCTLPLDADGLPAGGRDAT
jgi:signal transduction histidine kinase